MAFDFMELCIELGDTAQALLIMQQVCNFWLDPASYDLYVADPQCLCSLALVAQGEVNAALFSFREALQARPGTHAYDAVVDTLEDQLRGKCESGRPHSIR